MVVVAGVFLGQRGIRQEVDAGSVTRQCGGEGGKLDVEADQNCQAQASLLHPGDGVAGLQLPGPEVRSPGVSASLSCTSMGPPGGNMWARLTYAGPIGLRRDVGNRESACEQREALPGGGGGEARQCPDSPVGLEIDLVRGVEVRWREMQLLLRDVFGKHQDVSTSPAGVPACALTHSSQACRLSNGLAMLTAQSATQTVLRRGVNYSGLKAPASSG